MIEVIGVKFKSGGKMYYFAPGNFNPAEGSIVVVETARGMECGEVAARRHAVSEESITQPLRPILRLANSEDLQMLEEHRAKMAEAMRICQARIDERGLPMRLADVETSAEGNKLIFYFTAESRVDFRDLVKDLANTFRMRIELRQIGDRDEAKLLGGLGICGREFCCKGYLSSFQPITIKMAKEQGLALNPAKISGACGRLMCCLRYESPVYEELIKQTPKTGSTVLLPGDPPIRAYVMEANLITGNLRVKPENSDMPITVSRDSVERLTDASRRMTREDLRDRRGQQRPAAGKPAQPAQGDHAQEKAGEDSRKQQKKQRPQKQKPQGAKPEKPQQFAPQDRGSVPAQQTRAPQPKPAPEHSALYAEFGETRQQKPASAQPQSAPPRRTAVPIDMDFTEHRAVVEHPELAQQQGKQPQQQRPHRPRQQRPHGENRRRTGNSGGEGSGTPSAPQGE